jgi:o-succinylbenzoate---CoA ligase
VGIGQRLGVGSGDLLALDLPPGSGWVELVRELWSEGIAFLPLHDRLADRERRAIVDRARPSAVLDSTGESTLFGDPGSKSQGVGVVLATSGTEGDPKLVELPRAALEAAIASSAAVLGATPSDAWVACLTPAHVGGLLVLLRAAVLGSPVTVLERFDPRATALAGRGAFVSLVPTMVRRLVGADADLTPLATLLVGGGSLDPGTRRAAEARGARIVTTYGLTETCGGVAYDGVLFEGTEAHIAGGQIELRGPTLMEGYLHDPAATAAAFTVDGWLRTGDAGTIRDDGRLSVDGRLGEAIRTGGETVWPLEVEAAIRDHPKVADAAVVGRPHPEWGAQVVAFVVPAHAQDPPTLGELRDHASGRLARFKAPRELVLVEALPRTSSGKLRRSALR